MSTTTMRQGKYNVWLIVLACAAFASSGCMGEKVDAPTGSNEAKLEGRWVCVERDGDSTNEYTLDLGYRKSGSAKPAITGTLTLKMTLGGATGVAADAIIDKLGPGADAASAPTIEFLPDFKLIGGEFVGEKPNPLRSSLIGIHKIRLDSSDSNVIHYTTGTRLNGKESFTPAKRMTRKR